MDLTDNTINSSYSVRRALIEDAPALSVLIKTSMLSYCADSNISADILESTHESLDAVKNRIKYNDCLCLCDSSGSIQGTVTLSFTNNPLKYSFSKKSESFLKNYDKCIYISRFAVDSSLRGTGLGLMLLNSADDIAKELDYSLFLLHTALTNSERCNYYRNRGFEVLDFESSRGYPRGLFYKTI
ncbi:MAG: GNAT family N-acetyltransferase [Clostridia bacterium]|nr:GNAT family N-acetyltransferase [Clostridia bacterium]